MDNFIVSRDILMMVFALHCFLAVFFSNSKINASIKKLRRIFIIDVALVSGYIIYTCVTEPFYHGVWAAVLGYALVYFAMYLCWLSVKHWSIASDKIYQFIPQEFTEDINGAPEVFGYVEESGARVYGYVKDEELYVHGQANVPVPVRYHGYDKFAVRFDVVKTDA